MRRSFHAWGGVVRTCLLCGVILLSAGPARGDDSKLTRAVGRDQLWRETLEFAEKGEFENATNTIAQIHRGGELIEQVRTWLKEYQTKQNARKALDKADFEKYVGYAQARVERKEYSLALNWSLAALDCAANRDAFLQEPWLHNLANDALLSAEQFRQEQKWGDAYQIYAQLSSLFEREPRYQKLEREALTHLRLNAMFKKKSEWKERIEKVRWKDAEAALRHIDSYYVVDANFKEMAEHGLEQLLMLADSKTAQELFEGLKNEDDRNGFVTRIQARLEQVRAAPKLSWDGCRNQFRRVVRKINRETARLPEELVVSELMRGAFEPLDDFTTIIWPQDSKEFDKHTRGDFVGVGISIIKNRKDEIEVVTPLEDTSAYRQGVQAGDVITKVDGVELKGYSLNKVVDTITGPRDTHVTLTVRRNGRHIDFDLKRSKVRIRSVKGIRRDPVDEERWEHWLDRDQGIGYIRITNFQRNTVEDVDNVLSEMAAQGLKGLVLDLRRNPGGLLDSAWQLSSRFLKRGGVVVSTKGRIKSDNQTFSVPGMGAYADVPLIVLVDERSASASEIVSGAIRDNHRGIVIGERTFGKFSVQNLVPLGRAGAKLKITTARYYLPSGVSLHREPMAVEWGVSPDIPVRLVNKETINVYRLWRENNLLGPPKPKVKKDAKADANTIADKDAVADADKTDDNSTNDTAEGKGEDDAAGASEDKEDSTKEAKLPPLKQPDENDRPKEDAQLDTALLVMRLMLLGDAYPTLATAETDTTTTAKP